MLPGCGMYKIVRDAVSLTYLNSWSKCVTDDTTLIGVGSGPDRVVVYDTWCGSSSKISW